MILLDIKNYFYDKPSVNLKDLSLHFQRDPETMRDMLSHWIRKGIIKRIESPTSCGTSCFQCQPAIAEVYQLSSFEAL
jgi:putative ferrous iron transport protein C